MDYNIIIKDKFPTIKQSMSLHRGTANVLELDFKQIVLDNYGENSFLENDEIGVIKNEVKRKYNSDFYEDVIEKFGIKTNIDFKDLYYYQEKVEIENLINVNIEKPVSLLKINNKIVLINGYHRALISLLKGNQSIEGFLLEL